MTSEPNWLTELRSESVRGAAWLPPDKATERHDAIRRGKVGILGAANLFGGELQGALKDFRIIGSGPSSVDRHGQNYESLIWAAREQPAELLFAISSTCPPALWIPAGRDAASLNKVMNAYCGSVSDRPDPVRPSPDELTRVFETAGLQTPLEPTTRQWNAFFGLAQDLDQVEKAFVLGDFTDSFPTRLGTDAAGDFDDTGIRVSMFDTLHSGSRIVLFADPRPLAEHSLELLTVRVVYGAHEQGPVVANLNERLGVDFPEDLPLDVVGALSLDRPSMGEKALRRRLETGGTESEPAIELMALLSICSEPAEELLAPYVTHPDAFTRSVVVQIALAAGCRAIVEQAAEDADESVCQLAKEALADDSLW